MMRVADLIPNVTGSYPKDFLRLIELVDDQQKTNGDGSTDQLWPAYQYILNIASQWLSSSPSGTWI